MIHIKTIINTATAAGILISAISVPRKNYRGAGKLNYKDKLIK